MLMMIQFFLTVITGEVHFFTYLLTTAILMFFLNHTLKQHFNALEFY